MAKAKSNKITFLRETFVASVTSHGGPCKTPEDVHKVLSAVKFKKDIKAL